MKEVDKERFIEKTEYRLFGVVLFEKVRYFDGSSYPDEINNLTIENKVFDEL